MQMPETTLIMTSELETYLKSMNGSKSQNGFQEGHDGFSMSTRGFLKTSGSVIPIAAGVIFSGTVGGYLSRILPVGGKYTVIIAGILIMYLGKRKSMIKDFGAGVLIGGLSTMFAGFAGAIGTPTAEPMMNEVRTTYGGTDGVYPEQPARMTFR